MATPLPVYYCCPDGCRRCGGTGAYMARPPEADDRGDDYGHLVKGSDERD